MAGELTRLLGRTQIRASDAERERAVESLRHHYAAGRLTSDELEERIERAYDARTRGDIDNVLYDLPSDRGRRAAERVGEANRHAWRAHLTSYLSVNGGLTALWAVTGAGEFWPGWSMGIWGMFLGWHWMSARAVARRLSRRRDGRVLGSGRSSRPLPR
jgi:Domain of unknown function (DUF1707)/2TM domain